MIPFTDETYKEIVDFIKDITCDEYVVFNENAMTTPPNVKQRIGFTLDNFVSTGNVFNTTNFDITEGKYYPQTKILYNCQLSLFVYGKKSDIEMVTGMLLGAFHTKDYHRRFIHRLYLQTHESSVSKLKYDSNGVLDDVNAITINCKIEIIYGGKKTCNDMGVGYFDKVEHEVKEK